MRKKTNFKTVKALSCLFMLMALLFLVQSSLAYVPAIIEVIEETNPDHTEETGLTLERTMRLLDKEFPYTYAPLPSSVKTVDAAVKTIITQMKSLGINDEYDKALYLHDWLVMNANYDYSYKYYYADGVLLRGKGVCNSYSLAYQALLNAAGITNKRVVAMQMNHAWNLVKLNGQWSHVDVTWDDPNSGGYERHTYFGMNDEMISKDHKWTRSDYPACTSVNNLYYLHDSDLIAAFTKEDLYAQLSQAAENKLEKIKAVYIGSDPSFDIHEEFFNWYYSVNWKYGLDWTSITYSDFEITCRMDYKQPWNEPTVKVKIVDNDNKTLIIDLATAGTADEKLTYQLSAETKNLPEQSRGVFWSSSNFSVAEVDENGLVTGKKDGHAIIKATVNYSYKTASNYYYSSQVQDIILIKVVTGLNPKNINISGPDSVAVGKTIPLTANVTWPAKRPSNTGIVWKSTDESVATVSSGGVVKGIKDGNVTINVCFSADRSICKGHDMVVKAQGQSVIIVDKDNGKKSIDLGTKGSNNEKLTYQLGAIVLPAEASQAVTWKSSSPAIAEVDKNGLVTAKKAGSVTITATTADGTKKTDKIKITIGVMPQKNSLVISGGNEVAEKKTLKLTAAFNQAVPPTNVKVTWSSSDITIAKVSNAGVVTGKGGGTAVITVCSAADNSICAKQNVRVLPSVKVVNINNVENKDYVIDLAAGMKSYRLSATTEPKDASQSVTWKSSAPAVADVDQNGLVTAKKAGTVTITAKAADGSNKTAKIKLVIKAKVQPGSLKVSGGNAVGVKKKLTLTAVFNQNVQPTVKKIIWSSSDAKVAKVSATGVVTGVKAGTVQIRAAAKDDPSVYHEIKITVGPLLASAALPEAEDEMVLKDTDLAEAGDIEINPEESTSIISGNDDQPVGNEDTAGTEEMADGGNQEPEDTIKTGPCFAEKEQYLLVGESLILEVLNPDDEAIMVGLGGDTDAVLWNEDMLMLTSIGEAEVTAFLTTVDTVEVRDMMAIHIVNEIQEMEDASEETGGDAGMIAGDAEGMIETDETAEGADTSEAAEPVEGEVNIESSEEAEDGDTSEATEPIEGEMNTETGEEAEGGNDPEVTEHVEEEENIETGEPAESEENDKTGDAPEETPAAQPVEIHIRDLGENESLHGEANSILSIERELFELGDEVLRSLEFVIEDETIAKLTDRPDEETLLKGIEIQLLAAGETKLVIKLKGEEELLREIPLVVTASPSEEFVPDEGTVETAEVFEEKMLPDEMLSESLFDEVQIPAEEPVSDGVQGPETKPVEGIE